MSDNPKKVVEKMKKDPVWICADIWLGIFPFLLRRQLGLKIAPINGRFDRLVDGHFRTSKWTLGHLRICGKIGENDHKEMQIVKRVNATWESVPIPEEGIPLPAKVGGFNRIEISYMDHNGMAFLHRIRHLFKNCGQKLFLSIFGHKDARILAFIVVHIWPLISANICGMELFPLRLNAFRHFSPTILADCTNLKIFVCCGIFPEFPADDSANASDGQAVAKWLCTPRGIPPKVFKSKLHSLSKYSSELEEIKRQFVNASSRLNFIIVIHYFVDDGTALSFDLINELTEERLTMKRFFNGFHRWLLVRSPIVRDEKQWAEWEKEAIEWQWHDQWNKIEISICDEDYCNRDAMPC